MPQRQRRRTPRAGQPDAAQPDSWLEDSFDLPATGASPIPSRPPRELLAQRDWADAVDLPDPDLG